RGDIDTTWTLANRAVTVAGPDVDRGWFATAHTMLGIAAMRHGSRDARDLFERALAHHRAARFTRGLVWTLQLMADLEDGEGNTRESARYHRESLPLAVATGNQWALFEEFAGVALLAHARGLHCEAARLMGAAEATSAISGVLPRAGRETYER